MKRLLRVRRRNWRREVMEVKWQRNEMVGRMSRYQRDWSAHWSDLAAVLEEQEFHSPQLIQLFEHKQGCGRRVKFQGHSTFFGGTTIKNKAAMKMPSKI